MTENRQPVGLIETMRAERGSIALLDLHLDRLAESARAFGYPLDREAVRAQIRAALDAHASSSPGEPTASPDALPVSAARVRLVLWPGGRMELSATPLDRQPFQTAAVYPEPLEEAGTWRCTRKTTHREHYTRALGWAERAGVDEPIVLNTRGEVMEGARTNVFIRRGGVLFTPPLSAGGLAGVLRQSLVAGGAREAHLVPTDLERAEEVLLSNAVRGLMPVNFIASAA